MMAFANAPMSKVNAPCTTISFLGVHRRLSTECLARPLGSGFVRICAFFGCFGGEILAVVQGRKAYETWSK